MREADVARNEKGVFLAGDDVTESHWSRTSSLPHGISLSVSVKSWCLIIRGWVMLTLWLHCR